MRVVRIYALPDCGTEVGCGASVWAAHAFAVKRAGSLQSLAQDAMLQAGRYGPFRSVPTYGRRFWRFKITEDPA